MKSNGNIDFELAAKISPFNQ